MSALGIEVRRSPALWLLPALVLIGVFAAWRSLWPGVDVWRNASQSVVASVELLGPAVAGVGAWCAGREHRRATDYLDDLAARPAGTAVLVHLAAVVTCGVGAYAAVTVAVFARTLPGAHWGGPMWLWLLAGCLGLILHAVVGFVIGRSAPYRFVPPLVAFGCYAAQVYLINGGGAKSFLAAFSLQEQDVLFDTNQTLLAAQALWYAGLAAVVVLVWLAGAHRARRAVAILALAPAVAAAGCGGGLVMAQHGHFLLGPTAFTYDCTGADPQVCLHPAFGAGLGELDATIRPVAARLAGTSLAIHRVEQRDRGIGSTPSPGAVPIFVDDFRSGWARADMVEMLSVVLYGPSGENPCLWNDAKTFDPKDPGQYTDLVTAWIAGDGSLFRAHNGAGTRAARWFVTRSEAQRRQWLLAHVRELQTCSLTAADFAG